MPELPKKEQVRLYVINSNAYVTPDEVCSQLGVNIRTARNRLHELSCEGKLTKHKSDNRCYYGRPKLRKSNRPEMGEYAIMQDIYTAIVELNGCASRRMVVNKICKQYKKLPASISMIIDKMIEQGSLEQGSVLMAVKKPTMLSGGIYEKAS